MCCFMPADVHKMADTGVAAEDFCSEMRKKTQKIHDESDKLINLKLVVVLTDTSLWADVLADFYFVFQTIEKAMEEHWDDPYVAPLSHSAMLRLAAFEADLQYYLGSEWRALIKPSKAAQDYCDRIVQVSQEQSHLLIAYIHSMYLALVAGGQILKKIVKKTLGLSGDEGLALFGFSGATRTEIRKHLTSAINEMELSRDKKDAIIQEKIRCFKMNNAIAGSVQPTIKNYARICKFAILLVLVLLLLVVLALILFNSL